MENRTSFDKASPVHVLQDADAVHGYHSAETEADYADRFAIKLVSLKKENRE